MPVRRRLPAPERVHLNPARRAGRPPGAPWGRVGTDPYLDPGGDIHPLDALELPARTSSARPRGLLARSRPGAARQSLQVSPTRGRTGRAGGARRLPGTSRRERLAGGGGPGPRHLQGEPAPHHPRHRHRADSTHRRPARTPLAGPFPPPCGQHAQKTSTPRRPPSTRRTHPDPHPPTSPDRTTTSPVLTSNKYRSHEQQVPFSRRTSTVLANREAGGVGAPGLPPDQSADLAANQRARQPISRPGNRSAGLVTGTGLAADQRAWQRGHQKRRRPATSLAATGVAQRRQGRPVRW